MSDIGRHLTHPCIISHQLYTLRTCPNSRYQALFSDFSNGPGEKASADLAGSDDPYHVRVSIH